MPYAYCFVIIVVFCLLKLGRVFLHPSGKRKKKRRIPIGRLEPFCPHFRMFITAKVGTFFEMHKFLTKIFCFPHLLTLHLVVGRWRAVGLYS